MDPLATFLLGLITGIGGLIALALIFKDKF